MSRRLVRERAAVPLWLVIGAIALVGLGLRLYQLGSAPLWLDEAYSVWFSDRGWAYLWQEVPKFETHPSFYYSVLKLWRVFGEDEFTLRLLSTLISIATIPIVAATAFLCGGSRAGRLTAILSAALFACSATQVGASQDARPYVFMTLGFAVALLSAIRIITAGPRAHQHLLTLLRCDRRMAAAFIMLGMGIGLMAWSHNLGTLFGLWLGICLLVWWSAAARSGGLLVNLLFSAGLAGLIYAPNIPILLMQMETMGQHGFWLDRPGLREVHWTLIELPLGFQPYSRRSIALSYVALAAVLGGLWAISKAARRRRISKAVPVLLVVMAIAPAISTFVLSWIGQPIFLLRTFQPSQIPLIILMSFLPLIGARIRTPAIAILLILAVGTVWPRLRVNIMPGEDWREVVAEIAKSRRDPDEHPTVIVLPADAELPLLYYSRRLDVPLTLRALPGPYPAISSDYTYPSGGGGAPAIGPAVLHDLAAWVQDADRVWFVTRGAEAYDRDMLVAAMLKRAFPCTLRTLPQSQFMARPDESGACPVTSAALGTVRN